MPRKRLSWMILLTLMGVVGWGGYRATYQSALNHDLILASGAGDPSKVLLLLNRGADPNASEAKTPEMGWHHLLNVLLRNKEYFSRTSPLSQTMTDYERIAAPLNADHVKILRMLLEQGANPNVITPEETPLSLRAAREHDERVLLLLLQHGADPNVMDRDINSLFTNSLLMYAVDAHQTAVVQALLHHGARPNQQNDTGDTALMWAAHYRDITMVKLLLSVGADVNQKNKIGHSVLTYAITNNPLSLQENQKTQEMIDLLLAAGADPNASDPQGGSPFLYALNFVPDDGDLGIHSMLAHGGEVNRAIPRTLSKQEFSWNTISQGGSEGNNAPPGTTPLMLATISLRADLVRKLLAMGAEVNARDVKGKTALFYAETMGSLNAVNATKIRALLQHAGARR